jgi:hypothetical protein
MFFPPAYQSSTAKCFYLEQVVQEAERADLSDEEGNYPARAYVTLDLLERQLLGLRQQLCQVTYHLTPFFS